MTTDPDTPEDNTPVPHNGPGRPSKFTPEVREKVLQALRMGHYRSVAATYAGISHETLRRWMKEAENSTADPEFRAFRNEIDVAESQAEVIDLGFIRQAARDGEWRAAAWRLERAHPDRWGKKDQSEVHITGQIDHNIEIAVGADPISIGALAQSLANRALDQGEQHEVVDVEVIEESQPTALLPSHGGMPSRPRTPEPAVIADDSDPEGARES
jgi:transposase-like protein